MKGQPARTHARDRIRGKRLRRNGAEKLAKEDLWRLALKEMTDNAWDVSLVVSVGRLDETGGRFFVQDQGPGIAGGPDAAQVKKATLSGSSGM